MSIRQADSNPRLLEYTTQELIKEIASRSEVYAMAVQLPSHESEVCFAVSAHAGAAYMAADLATYAYKTDYAAGMVEEHVEENPQDVSNNLLLQQIFDQAMESFDEDTSTGPSD